MARTELGLSGASSRQAEQPPATPNHTFDDGDEEYSLPTRGGARPSWPVMVILGGLALLAFWRADWVAGVMHYFGR